MGNRKGGMRGIGNFPATQHSVIVALRSGDPVERSRSLEQLVRSYWRAVYTYLRLRWHKAPSEAEEITQEFFLRSIDKGTFAAYDSNRSRFRTFVRVCIDRLVLDLARRERAGKRGGGQSSLLDFADAERGLSARPDDDPERLFEIEWLRGLVRNAVECLRATCDQRGKQVHFRVFERIDLAGDPGPSYAEVAEELGISLVDVTNRLHYVRRELRAILLASLREGSADEREFADAARLLLGVHV
jgi:RNA polymerase sigma-70 factor (ECF subfamily)